MLCPHSVRRCFSFSFHRLHLSVFYKDLIPYAHWHLVSQQTLHKPFALQSSCFLDTFPLDILLLSGLFLFWIFSHFLVLFSMDLLPLSIPFFPWICSHFLVPVLPGVCPVLQFILFPKLILLSDPFPPELMTSLCRRS